MSNEDFPLKERIIMVHKIKDEILRHTTILSEHLQKLEDRDQEHKDDVRIIKREIRTIIKEFSKISSFCNDKSKKQIQQYSGIGSQFNILTTDNSFYTRRRIIDYWATIVNSIELNYDEYPFDITGGLEINLEIFKGYIKTGYSRIGFPGGFLGGASVVIIILVGLFFLLKNRGII